LAVSVPSVIRAQLTLFDAAVRSNDPSVACSRSTIEPLLSVVARTQELMFTIVGRHQSSRVQEEAKEEADRPSIVKPVEVLRGSSRDFEPNLYWAELKEAAEPSW
jgi:hypothetical protein